MSAEGKYDIVAEDKVTIRYAGVPPQHLRDVVGDNLRETLTVSMANQRPWKLVQRPSGAFEAADGDITVQVSAQKQSIVIAQGHGDHVQITSIVFWRVKADD